MKKILFLLLMISLGSMYSYAQETYDIAKETIRSPQVADMMRFDKVGGISKLSGRLDLNIEVARIKDKDFDLPVTICYNSAGFMPSKPESYVGLNWSLSAGGAIVREVRGRPDDLILPYAAVGDEINDYAYGFIHFVKNPDIFPKNMDIAYIASGGFSGETIFLENIYFSGKHGEIAPLKTVEIDPSKTAVKSCR